MQHTKHDIFRVEPDRQIKPQPQTLGGKDIKLMVGQLFAYLVNIDPVERVEDIKPLGLDQINPGAGKVVPVDPALSVPHENEDAIPEQRGQNAHEQ